MLFYVNIILIKMICLRAALSFINQLCISVIFIEPAKKMGTCEGDKIYVNGNKNRTFIRKVCDHIMLCCIPIMFYSYRECYQVTFIDYFYILLAIVGMFIRLWAYYTLGELFTFEIGIRKDHNIITSGPYRYFAHPGYLGNVLTYIALIFLHNINIFVSLILLGVMVYALYERISEEEKMLRKEFPTYNTYYNETYTPYLFSRNGLFFMIGLFIVLSLVSV